jgi:hypothetical protein
MAAPQRGCRALPGPAPEEALRAAAKAGIRAALAVRLVRAIHA